jgi:hypothetical protein
MQFLPGAGKWQLREQEALLLVLFNDVLLTAEVTWIAMDGGKITRFKLLSHCSSENTEADMMDGYHGI